MSPPASPAPPARSRLDPRLVGMQRGQPISGPQTLHIDVTNGCNTNCVTCWDHSPLLQLGRSVAWKKQKIDAATVSDILNDVAELGGLRAVILSGMGEPFTHPDIYQMIAEVKRRGLHLTLITNLVAADAQRVVELGVDQLLIGIHGASESSYRSFHPNFVRDEWPRLLGMLQLFADHGRRYKHVHVICQTNAAELVEIVQLGLQGAQLGVGQRRQIDAIDQDTARRRRERTARELQQGGRDGERVAHAGLVICRQRPGTAKGFVFMDTPGYDPVSATGQVAGGANLICFTTGRGSAYGCAPSPSLKLSTNTALWLKQEDDIDINCGEVVDGTASIDELGERIFRLMLETASGRHTKSELHGYGQNEFVPWQLGAVM